jgi:hypothetical protein
MVRGGGDTTTRRKQKESRRDSGWILVEIMYIFIGFGCVFLSSYQVGMRVPPTNYSVLIDLFVRIWVLDVFS